MIEMLMRFRADASGVERALAKTRDSSKKYAQAIGAELRGQLVAAFSAGAVIASVRSFVGHVRETVDEIKDMSELLGISTDEVQRMQAAAIGAGVKFSVVTTALERIESLRAQAAAGDKQAVGLFAALGIDPTQGNALAILEQAVAALDSGKARSSDLFALVGKANRLRAVIEEMHRLGPIELISKDQIQDIDKANAALDEAKRRLTVEGAPVVAKGVNALADFVAGQRMTSVKGFNLASMFGPGGTIGATAFASIRRMMGGNAAASSVVGGEAGVAPPLSAPVSAAASRSLGAEGDALSRIGLFVGGRPEARSLASIERNTAAAARQTERQTKILMTIEELLQSL